MNNSRNAAHADYKTVRGLSRGLLLLRVMNKLENGATAAQLAELSGLHRTTVRRLLETLQDEGYVRCSESDGRYLLELKVRDLAEGFRDEEWISGVAVPLLGTLLQQVVWPTDLCTLDLDAMIVRETTHRFSRLSFHRAMVGRRLPLLTTATGRAYLAFCPDAEREQLIGMLATSQGEDSELARNRFVVDNMLRLTRERGYGQNYMEWGEEGRIAAIALPIRRDGRVLGCLNLVYLAQAMSIEQAANRYLHLMQQVVERIENAAEGKPEARGLPTS